MLASPARRRRLLQDQKNPPPFMVTYYDDAMAPIREFYELGGTDDRVVTNAMDRIAARIPATDFEEQRNNSCIEALAAFLDLLDDFSLADYGVRLGEPDPPKLVVSGVQISVRPELLLYRENELVGAVKFNIAKGSPLERQAAEYIAATVHQYVEEMLARGNALAQDSFVVDLFSKRYLRAPRSSKRRRRDVEAACEEIAARWATL